MLNGFSGVPDQEDSQAQQHERGSKGSRIWDSISWLVSRTLLVLILIGISYGLKIPVDNIIRQKLAADYESVQEEEQIKRIQKSKALYRTGRDATRAVRAVNDALIQYGNPERIGALGWQIGYASEAVGKFRREYLARGVRLREPYEKAVLTLLQSLGRNIEQARSVAQVKRLTIDQKGQLEARISLSERLLGHLKSQLRISLSKLEG